MTTCTREHNYTVEDAESERTGALAALRASCAAAGITAESPSGLDAEAERLAREERWT